MVPPLPQLDLSALSGIAGSVSIAFWVAVFTPQILLNFRRKSAEGLSLAFLVVWLAGDVFNIVGGVLQGVLPTMLILAVYYTLADLLLLLQCLYYNRLNASPTPTPTPPSPPSPEHPLPHHHHNHNLLHPSIPASHLSPVTPLLPPTPPPPTAPLLSPLLTILLITLSGLAGWYLSPHSSSTPPPSQTFSPAGQTFGYLSALLYLLSRIPQIVLNYQRKSCEGVSVLFFVFAGIGNAAFVVSVVGFVPAGEGDWREEWRRHLAVNASWLVGSLGTMVLDAVVFWQFVVYQKVEEWDEEGWDEDEMDEEEEEEGERERRNEGRNGARNGGRNGGSQAER
ncbi:PQ-loop-domain-containing protein [Ascodesmis nigricans]|uniref:PQ-loop-domain-containing protein n=1 Tax=Ascodesmis nigricans TaxID=341454 RepID=A0A4S2N0P1_9PEZI|nr:PQ-loop-domain-containing protein [Ascodesmis nigricans]